jgi:hypothetical protein
MMDTEYVALAARAYGSIVNHTTCERPKGGLWHKMMNAMPAVVTERSRTTSWKQATRSVS